MFNYSQFEKQKLERAKFLNVYKIPIGPSSIPVSADKQDQDLQDAHIKSIISER